MIFTFILMDKPDSAELRQLMRPQHKAYLAAAAERIAFAGPFTSDDGQTMIGSLLAIDEVAQAAGTIGYELMCALAPRVPVHPA